MTGGSGASDQMNNHKMLYTVKDQTAGELIRYAAFVSKVMKRKILVINDDFAVLHAYNDILTHGEYECLLALNYEEVTKALSEETIDLIIEDLHRQDEDAFEFYSNLQDKNKYRDIPIIIISAVKPPRAISLIDDDPIKKRYRVVLLKNLMFTDKYIFPVILEMERYLVAPTPSEEVLNLIVSCLDS